MSDHIIPYGNRVRISDTSQQTIPTHPSRGRDYGRTPLAGLEGVVNRYHTGARAYNVEFRIDGRVRRCVVGVEDVIDLDAPQWYALTDGHVVVDRLPMTADEAAEANRTAARATGGTWGWGLDRHVHDWDCLIIPTQAAGLPAASVVALVRMGDRMESVIGPTPDRPWYTVTDLTGDMEPDQLRAWWAHAVSVHQNAFGPQPETYPRPSNARTPWTTPVQNPDPSDDC